MASKPLAGQQSSSVAVSYQEVSKTYGSPPNEVVAIEDIDFDIPRQSFVSVVGPSGCGKSTLLHLSAGLLEPTSGTVMIDDADVNGPDHENHRIGMVFQQPVLLDWRTIKKNILLTAEIMHKNGDLTKDMQYYRRRADELINLVGLEGFGDSYPRELSGGMQQRASICRGLIHDPKVLLMDEPFGALDALTRDKMNTELLRIWRETKKTIIFVTHNLEEAVYLSDYVVVLSERPGRILDIVDVDIERPRKDKTRNASEYHNKVDTVYEYFNE